MDAKSELNLLCQREGISPLPRYESNQTGPSHDPTFVSKVRINGKKYRGKPSGNRKEAEKSAAARALESKSFLNKKNGSLMGLPDDKKEIENDENTVILVDYENVHDVANYKGNFVKFVTKGHPLEKDADIIVPSRYSDAVDVYMIMEATRHADQGKNIVIVSKDKIFLPLGDFIKARIVTSMEDLYEEDQDK